MIDGSYADVDLVLIQTPLLYYVNQVILILTSIFKDNGPFAASHSHGTKPPCWRAKVAQGQDKQRKLPFKIMYLLFQRRFESKQGHRQPHIHSKARVLSPQL